MKPNGRPADPRRAEYMERFGLSLPNLAHKIPSNILDQLDACKDDEARRLLLGVQSPQEEN